MQLTGMLSDLDPQNAERFSSADLRLVVIA